MKIAYEQIICSLFLWFKTLPATKPEDVVERVPSNTIVWSHKNSVCPLSLNKIQSSWLVCRTLSEVVHKFIVILFWEILPTRKPEYSLSLSSLFSFFFFSWLNIWTPPRAPWVLELQINASSPVYLPSPQSLLTFLRGAGLALWLLCISATHFFWWVIMPSNWQLRGNLLCARRLCVPESSLPWGWGCLSRLQIETSSWRSRRVQNPKLQPRSL